VTIQFVNSHGFPVIEKERERLVPHFVGTCSKATFDRIDGIMTPAQCQEPDPAACVLGKEAAIGPKC
jgi:hypothetical protein